MKQKNIILLGIILAVLAFGIFLKYWMQSSDYMVQSSKDISEPPLFGFDSAQIEKILIGRGLTGAPVELARENAEWRVKSLWNSKADPAKVNQLLEKIRTARGELRGTSKGLFMDFGIRDEEAYSIKLMGQNNSVFLDLRVGMRQAGMEGYFFRRGNSEEVYFVDVDMAGLLGIYSPFEVGKPANDFWTDLVLFSLHPEQVQQISLTRLGEKSSAGVVLEADPKEAQKREWKFIRKDLSSPLDPDKVIRFIATLNSIKGQKLVDPNGAGYGFEKPTLAIVVKESEKEITLTLGAKDEKENIIYVKISGSPSVFCLSSYYLSDLDIDDTHFFKELTPSPAPISQDAKEQPPHSPESPLPPTPGKAS